MRSICRLSGSKVALCLLLLTFIGSPLVSRGASSATSSDDPQNLVAKAAQDATIPALMISDIHFDPFHDPAKVRRLVDAPVSRWRSILSGPPSPNQQQAFTSLQQNCHARGVDTPYPLLRSSLRAMRSRQPDAKFITLTGDLIAHSFVCRYTMLFPQSTSSDYRKFVLKTVSFVLGSLHASFPRVPVYVALGNNDSPCGDYRLDAKSDFLARIGSLVTNGLPSSERQLALKEFAESGSYSVVMAAPMQDTRLIVLDDLFLSSKYTTCGGEQDAAAENAEMTWLQNELSQARQSGQKIWVMGHIPTGIDPYSTAAKFGDICGHIAPVMFLSSAKLADLLIEYADVVRLGIFAHTHMDEIRLLDPEGSDSQTSLEHSVVIKMIPSISPVDGNDPSFTVARVNPASAVLQDYQVIAASNHTGIATTWSREYDYAKTYQEAQFSPSSVKQLIEEFNADRGAATEASKQYIRYYYIGDRSPELKPFWPQYVCALANHTADAYAACVCPTGK